MKVIRYLFSVVFVLIFLGILVWKPSIDGDPTRVLAAQEQDTLLGAVHLSAGIARFESRGARFAGGSG